MAQRFVSPLILLATAFSCIQVASSFSPLRGYVQQSRTRAVLPHSPLLRHGSHRVAVRPSGGEARMLTRLRMQGEGRSVGIDLGTTNSAVSAVVDGRPVIIPNKFGKPTTPSVVAFRSKGSGSDEVDILVGAEALQVGEGENFKLFSSIKRIIGRSKKDALTAAADPAVADTFIEAEDGSVLLPCAVLGRNIDPAEFFMPVLGEKVTRAVITVPAYFNDRQREATEAAGLLAGLEKVKILREPEAAALAYGLEKREDELILVFDLGGGTFDVSVLEVGGGIIEVIWTGGDSFLGGDDFDKEIASSVLKAFSEQCEEEGTQCPSLDVVKKDDKTKLSTARVSTVEISDFIEGKDLKVNITSKMIESMCKPLFDRLAVPVRQVALMSGIELQGELMDWNNAAKDVTETVTAQVGSDPLDYKALKKQQSQDRKNAKLIKKQKAEVQKVQKRVGGIRLRKFPAGRRLSEVILVGGGTKMPSVTNLIRTMTGLTAKKTIDPDEAVSLGAAIQAGMMDGLIQGFEVLSPLQAALLRGFARKRMQEEQGTYKPLTGDPEDPPEDEDWEDDEWLEDEEIADFDETEDQA
ncbi:hsp70, chloroplastic [Guillardia theta CCMP2712]|uniref:Hsp70, chloroplastic n=1 Tax=Guillardia theta (strain CCMP2712) TaxID=905079 RepID=L1J612_GUITC|nr:hsp70, chloroplastic [Guillardia theta CCMP2712]EKX43525.1 hsp70, chloroplastic [Guillardia theta CCMP2712]|eukprot:XP_005830505.1 hsp70, chloroplastic [Guillardia theta CCMP2712]